MGASPAVRGQARYSECQGGRGLKKHVCHDRAIRRMSSTELLFSVSKKTGAETSLTQSVTDR